MSLRSGSSTLGLDTVDRAASGLRVHELSFRRGAEKEPKFTLDKVSLAVPRGRLLAIVGPSGAGKSTLLSLLAGFERATSGTITFDGIDCAGLDPTARGIGMSFDDAALHEHLTVVANIDSAALPRDEPRQRRHDRVKSLARTLGIEPLLGRLPATLSAGERRRVSVARAFIRSPKLVLLDEPFANLDRTNRFTIRQMVRELQRSTGSAGIVVTHDPTDALAIADDLLVLIGGRVRAFGPANEVAARPVDLEVAQLVDDLGMHVVEITETGNCANAVLSPEFRARLSMLRSRASATGSTLVGLRPWQIRVGVPTAPSITFEAELLAREPAGLFTDLIGLRADGRTLRARVPSADAQELPIQSVVAFHVHESDAHLFAAPWPGRRID